MRAGDELPRHGFVGVDVRQVVRREDGGSGRHDWRHDGCALGGDEIGSSVTAGEALADDLGGEA